MRGADHHTTEIARRLRTNQTRAETLLWRRLRNRQIDGHKFVRQEPIQNYVCDFVCRDQMLIIEADGGQHCESAADNIRDAALRAAGFRVLQFWNNDVFENIDGVLAVIQNELIKSGPSPQPSPRKNGEREQGPRGLVCARCGTGFTCTLDGACWCMDEAFTLPMPAEGEDCLCPQCLRAMAHRR